MCENSPIPANDLDWVFRKLRTAGLELRSAHMSGSRCAIDGRTSLLAPCGGRIGRLLRSKQPLVEPADDVLQAFDAMPGLAAA